jgi:hypothetical protein
MAHYGLHPIRITGKLVVGDLTLVVGIVKLKVAHKPLSSAPHVVPQT